jgi:hypothetical protein
MLKKTKEPTKRANHKGNIKFPNPLVWTRGFGHFKISSRNLEASKNSSNTYYFYNKFCIFLKFIWQVTTFDLIDSKCLTLTIIFWKTKKMMMMKP